MIEYKIIKEIAMLNDRGNQQLRLNIIKWGTKPPRYDLRIWIASWPEGWIPGKGLLLSGAEARKLCQVLEKDFLLADQSMKQIAETIQNDQGSQDVGEGAQEAENEILTF